MNANVCVTSDFINMKRYQNSKLINLENEVYNGK